MSFLLGTLCGTSKGSKNLQSKNPPNFHCFTGHLSMLVLMNTLQPVASKEYSKGFKNYSILSKTGSRQTQSKSLLYFR